LATSSTVTGTALPSSVKTRVIPILRPTSPRDIFVVLCFTKMSRRLRLTSGFCYRLLQLDFHIHAGRQIELHQLVDRLVGRVDDVHQPQVRSDLELIARRLVHMRRAKHVVALDLRRQRHRATDHGAGALRRLDDLHCRLVDQLVIERLQPDTDALVVHVCPLVCPGFFCYSMTLATTPAPTVRPPSRIAKRSPSSIAIGAISVTVIPMLSPGITISVPAGNSQLPVTSVVRK